jgi:hypothetical protein
VQALAAAPPTGAARAYSSSGHCDALAATSRQPDRRAEPERFSTASLADLA